MTEVLLNQAVPDSRLGYVNFFNGRLLTAETLRGEQTAQAERARLLARATGFGVVEGLHVSGAVGATTLRVTAGLGINRFGDTLGLGDDIDLLLLDIAEDGADGGFRRCDKSPAVDGQGGIGDGLYVLLVSPTSVAQGRAPRLGGDEGGATCGQDRNTAALRFHVRKVADSQTTRFDAAAQGLAYWRSRSRLADDCVRIRQLDGLNERDDDFGSLDLSGSTGYLRDLVKGQGLAYGVERLFGLGGGELPLAVLHWSDGGLRFVDMWAARRGVARPHGGGLLAPVANDMRDAAGRARMMQFQDLITAIAASPQKDRSAAELFDLLPPAGFLPASVAVSSFFPQATFPRSVCEHVGEIHHWLIESWRRAPTITATGAPLLTVSVPQGVFFMRCEPVCCGALPLPTSPVDPVPDEEIPVVEEGEQDSPEEQPVATGGQAAPPTSTVDPTGRVVVYIGLTGKGYDGSNLNTLRAQAEHAFTATLTQFGHQSLNGRIVGTDKASARLQSLNSGVDWVAMAAFDDVPPGPATVSVVPLAADRFEPEQDSGQVLSGKTLALDAVFSWTGAVADGKTDAPGVTAPGGDIEAARPGKLWDTSIKGWLREFDKLWIFRDLIEKYPEELWRRFEDHGGIPPELDDPIPEEYGFDPAHEVHLFLDPAYDPGSLANGPYAWLVDATTGFAAPVVLTTAPKDDLAAGIGERLGASDSLKDISGGDYTALAAAAWPEFMAGLAGVSTETVRETQSWLAESLNLKLESAKPGGSGMLEVAANGDAGLADGGHRDAADGLSKGGAADADAATGLTDIANERDAAVVKGGVTDEAAVDLVADTFKTGRRTKGFVADEAGGLMSLLELEAMAGNDPAGLAGELAQHEMEYRQVIGNQAFEAMTAMIDKQVTAPNVVGFNAVGSFDLKGVPK